VARFDDDETPSVVRVLDRIERLVESVAELAERVARVEVRLEGQTERVAQFWERDWPEVHHRLERVEGRFDDRAEKVDARLRALESQQAGIVSKLPLAGGIAGGAAAIAELLHLLRVVP